jgi:hypothetical protein
MMVRLRAQTPKPGPANFPPDDSNTYFPPRVIFDSRFITAWRHKTPLIGIMNHELLEIYCELDLEGVESKNSLRANGYHSLSLTIEQEKPQNFRYPAATALLWPVVGMTEIGDAGWDDPRLSVLS